MDERLNSNWAQGPSYFQSVLDLMPSLWGACEETQMALIVFEVYEIDWPISQSTFYWP